MRIIKNKKIKPLLIRATIALLAVFGVLFADSNWSFPFWQKANIWVVFILKFLILMVLYAIGEFAKSKIDRLRQPFYQLADMQRELLKENIFITTFNEVSGEMVMCDGDEIHIITDDIKEYDLPFVTVIAGALKRGTKYFYYLPLNENGQKNDILINETKIFVKSIITELSSRKESNAHIQLSLDNLHFYDIGESAEYSYNYSLSLFSKNNTRGEAIDNLCWYQAVHSLEPKRDKLFSKAMKEKLANHNITIPQDVIADITKNAQVIVRVQDIEIGHRKLIAGFKQTLCKLINSKIVFNAHVEQLSNEGKTFEISNIALKDTILLQKHRRP
ncbi:MAG: hypothetical protein LBT55_05400 [Clostridiaceae bacterium]|jgi:hypothetical protein|nr:hypothetical protein [Clostridiaceae bacterium]